MRNDLCHIVSSTTEDRFDRADSLEEALRIEGLLRRHAQVTEHERRAFDGNFSDFTSFQHMSGERIEIPVVISSALDSAVGIAAGLQEGEPVWRMPLFKGYRRLLDSKVADINNAPGVAFGGAITAALYLQEFVPDDVPWAHFDMMAWNNSAKPGRPEGGEAQAARAIFGAIEHRVSNRG